MTNFMTSFGITFVISSAGRTARRWATIAAGALCLLGVQTVSVGTASAATPGASIRRADAIALAEKVADYQIALLAGGELPPSTNPDTGDPRGWIQGAFFVGLTALADQSSKDMYRQAILARGRANQWQLGKRVYHADDHVIGSTYIWASEHGAGPEAIAPLRTQFDKILRYPP
ncbi:MAG TPA: glycoside hydrolase family 88 protein, partial [Steroidobacteraceae bacterium]|nr:glycoside hydrolase family 88 protein [Steroidobacteraceae bacterium]